MLVRAYSAVVRLRILPVSGLTSLANPNSAAIPNGQRIKNAVNMIQNVTKCIASVTLVCASNTRGNVNKLFWVSIFIE